jgi:hypothetical protein
MLINRRTIRIELETAIPQVSCSTQGILSGSMPARRLSLRPLVFLEEI